MTLTSSRPIDAFRSSSPSGSLEKFLNAALFNKTKILLQCISLENSPLPITFIYHCVKNVSFLDLRELHTLGKWY